MQRERNADNGLLYRDDHMTFPPVIYPSLFATPIKRYVNCPLRQKPPSGNLYSGVQRRQPALLWKAAFDQGWK